MIQKAIASLVEGRELSGGDAREVAREILDGEATPCQIASLITALRIRGEKPEHIRAFAETLREKATPVRKPQPIVLDTCGTGGDGAGTFNVSTCAAIIAAAAGVCVAKHGNRAMSGKCGGADVLAALGVNINSPLEVTQRCLDEIGLCFLFAPAHHGAMKHAVVPRREVGIRSIFNMVGPLSNPAGATHQLIGVYSAELTDVFANVLRELGTRRALVVHGHDGLDEVSTTGETKVSELNAGKVQNYTIHPEDFGIPRASLRDLLIDSLEDATDQVRRILNGEKGPRADLALLNAGAALHVAEKSPSISQGVQLARETVASGKAWEKLEALVRLTNGR